MPSTYSALLRTEMQATGENSGTWGVANNTNIGTLLEASIAGLATVVIPNANYTLTALNGVADEARSMGLNLTGTLTATRNVICPSTTKMYVVKNATVGGFTVTVKTAAGTGIAVANGAWVVLFCDGTNVNQVTISAGGALGTPLSGTLTNCTGLPLTTGITGILGSTNGGTGNGFTKFSGATTAEKTYTLPNANATLLYAGGDLSIPSYGDLSNCVNLPISTGTKGAGTGVIDFLVTPSSANLLTALTTKTGSGVAVFNTSPTFVTPALGTPSSGTVTNLTGTAAININGTVGATTPADGAFTTLSATGLLTLTGGQAAFPAVQVPSADANTLDDYEEGTFTPAITGSVTVGAGTYSMQLGYYTKIGNLVTCSGMMVWSAHTGTGNMNIGGLPFTIANVSNNYPVASLYVSNLTSPAGTVIEAIGSTNSAVILLYSVATGGGAAAQITLDTAGTLYFTISYRV